MYVLKRPYQDALDERWHDRIKPLIMAVGETFDLLMPPAARSSDDYIQFTASGGARIPDLYPELTDPGQLEAAREALAELKRAIEQDEKSEIVRMVYLDKIDEIIANADMILAAGRRDDKTFEEMNSFVYGGPDPAVYAAACRWIRSEAERLKTDRPDMSEMSESVLRHIPDVRGSTDLLIPDDVVFQAVKELHFMPGGYIEQLFGHIDLAAPGYIARQEGDVVIERAIQNVGSKFRLADSPTGLWAYLVSKRQVVRPRNFVLSPQAFYGIVAHEVGSHLLELENGARSRLRLTEYGLARFEAGNEGRAFLREQIMYEHFQDYVSQLLWHPTKASFEYRVAIHIVISLAMGLNGRAYSFTELYNLLCTLFRFWTAQRGSTLDEELISRGAWSMCVRALKGTGGKGGAYLKDIVYLEGHVRCWRVARKYPELIMLGDCGKFDIANPKHILFLEDLGIIPPKT